MSNLDDDIREALAGEEALCNLDKEKGLVGEWLSIYHGSMRWMAIFATIETVVVLALIVWTGIEFFRADDTKWQIFYATCVILLCMALLLIKLWGWMQMNRNAVQREIKRLELRLLQQRADKS